MPYCHTCDKFFQSLGIARHRAAHRDRREDCTISLADGTYVYEYSKKKKHKDREAKSESTTP